MILEHKGVPVFYEDQGKGAAIVLLHGFLENISMWKDIVPILSKSHRVISIDLLGHGKTPCLGYVHTMDLMAEAVHAVLKPLRLRKVILIGHSMGGYVSLAFAEKYLEKVKGICLMNSSTLADDKDRKKLRERANKMVQSNFTNMVRMSFTNLFGEESRTVYKLEMEEALQEALQTPVQGYIACQEGMRIRPDRTAVLQKATYPKLFVIGKKDPVLSYKKSLEEVESTNSEMVVFNDGHMSHIENKKALIIALQSFVKSV